MVYINNWLNQEWANPEYQESKKYNFNTIKDYLQQPPVTLLDIGCGLAWESRLFQKTFNTELWLLDGDTSANEDKPITARDVNYNTSADNFLFYYPLEKLNQELIKLETENYHLVDCNNIDIQEDIKFDLITSYFSCGFHYPVKEYKELIQRHSHENTRIILDLRCSTKSRTVVLEDDIEIVNVLINRTKSVMAEIKFKN